MVIFLVGWTGFKNRVCKWLGWIKQISKCIVFGYIEIWKSVCGLFTKFENPNWAKSFYQISKFDFGNVQRLSKFGLCDIAMWVKLLNPVLELFTGCQNPLWTKYLHLSDTNEKGNQKGSEIGCLP